jgi:hypothetical protein
MSTPENHIELSAPWGPRDGEEDGGATTNASFDTWGPFEVGTVIRFASNVDFNWFMDSDGLTAATTSHMIQMYTYAPMEVTIEYGLQYLNTINTTTTGTLWISQIHPALNLKDKED